MPFRDARRGASHPAPRTTQRSSRARATRSVHIVPGRGAAEALRARAAGSAETSTDTTRLRHCGAIDHAAALGSHAHPRQQALLSSARALTRGPSSNLVPSHDRPPLRLSAARWRAGMASPWPCNPTRSLRRACSRPHPRTAVLRWPEARRGTQPAALRSTGRRRRGLAGGQRGRPGRCGLDPARPGADTRVAVSRPPRLGKCQGEPRP